MQGFDGAEGEACKTYPAGRKASPAGERVMHPEHDSYPFAGMRTEVFMSTGISQKTENGKSKSVGPNTPKSPNVRRIAVVGILSALTLALSLIPQIGYITIPGLGVQITIVHIPVIIAGIIEGPVVGAFVGLIFGLSSLYTALTSPLPIAFAFLNPLVSILPRIFIGIVAWYAYRGITFLTWDRARALSIGLAAAAGTVTNTIGVLGMIYLLYAKRFLEAIGLQGISPALAIFGLAMPNFPLELAAAVLLAIPVALAVKRMKRE